MLLAVPFIEIRGKQKITMASICDKKELLKNFSLIVKRYKRPPKIARREVTHNFSFSHSAFSRPTHFFKEKALGTRSQLCSRTSRGDSRFMHQSAASPWGPPPGTLRDLSKCPFKPHQIPLGIRKRNSDKIARIYKALKLFADLQKPICYKDPQNRGINITVYQI